MSAVRVWRVYLREGPNAEGKYWGREFGTDYPTRAEAEQVKADFTQSWPNHQYFIRAAAPRYRQPGVPV